ADGIRACHVTGVQTCALPISARNGPPRSLAGRGDGHPSGLPAPPGTAVAGRRALLRSGLLRSGLLGRLGVLLPTGAVGPLLFLEIGRASCRARAIYMFLSRFI